MVKKTDSETDRIPLASDAMVRRLTNRVYAKLLREVDARVEERKTKK